MSKVRTSRKLRTARGKDGQAIVEGAAFLMVFVPIAVAAILLLLVTATLGYYHVKLAQIADAGARVAKNEKFWNGALRPTFDPSPGGASSQLIMSTLETVWTKMQMPGTMDATIDWSDPNGVTVTVTANALPVHSGGWLPHLISIADTATEPFEVDRPISVYGLELMGGQNTTLRVELPSYGAEYNGTYCTFPTAAPQDWSYYVTSLAYPGTPQYGAFNSTSIRVGTAATSSPAAVILNGPTLFNQVGGVYPSNLVKQPVYAPNLP